MTTLVLGSFDMTKSDGTTRVLADGTSRGNPVPIEVTVKTWLQDGSVVITQGVDNREVHVRVRFFGTDLAALNALEASLMGELEKPNTLTWTPATGPATVFVVVTSSLDFVDEQVANEEQDDPWRTYDVRLVCEARTRSVAETVTAALPANGTTTTLVNDGSATTGWTGAVNGVTTAPSVVSGAVKVSSSATTGAVTCSLTLTASIATSSTKYLPIDWKPETPAGTPGLRAFGDGTELLKVGEAVSPTAGFTRTWFYVVASSIAVLRLDSASGVGFTNSVFPPLARSLYVDNVSRSDVKPVSGTASQLLRSIDVAGSARAPGSIAIEHATSALGDVIAYFFPDSEFTTGYSPACRPYFVSGGTTTSDAAMVSGARNNNGFTAQVYDVPIAKLASGLHLLTVKGSGSAVPTVMSWSAQLRINGTNVGAALTGSVTRTPSATQAFYTLGRLNLPPNDVNEALSNAVVRISLSTGMTALDEVYLFNTTIGTLLGPVSCGTASPASGGAANRLFLEPPSPATPRPTVRIGFAADRSDSYFPGATSGQGFMAGWQLPQFNPPRVNVFTVTTNALDASVTLRYYPRWHTNAAA